LFRKTADFRHELEEVFCVSFVLPVIISNFLLGSDDYTSHS